MNHLRIFGAMTVALLAASLGAPAVHAGPIELACSRVTTLAVGEECQLVCNDDDWLLDTAGCTLVFVDQSLEDVPCRQDCPTPPAGPEDEDGDGYPDSVEQERCIEIQRGDTPLNQQYGPYCVGGDQDPLDVAERIDSLFQTIDRLTDPETYLEVFYDLYERIEDL